VHGGFVEGLDDGLDDAADSARLLADIDVALAEIPAATVIAASALPATLVSVGGVPVMRILLPSGSLIHFRKRQRPSRLSL
jgi:hypothetical protein